MNWQKKKVCLTLAMNRNVSLNLFLSTHIVMIDIVAYEQRWALQARGLAKKSQAAFGLDEENMRALVGEIEENMRSYADSWQSNATQLKQSGVYRKIAQFVKPSEMYLDIGCGSGDLVEAVNFPNALGVDINHYSLATAEMRFRQHGLDVNAFALSFLKWVPGKGIVIVPGDGDSYELLQRGKANFLQDDLRVIKPNRSLAVTRRHMKEVGRPDYVTYTLVGGSSHTAGELYVRDDERKLSSKALVFEAVQTASELLPRGGHYVQVLRYVKHPRLADDIRNDFACTFGDIFAVEEIESFDLPEERLDNRFHLYASDIGSDTLKDPRIGKNVALVVVKARRK